MEANEVCRQKAAELHELAVQAGADPWNSYQLALREAGRRQLEVERVQPGDVRLRGSRALFDPSAWLILHEATGDGFMDAFLVAHELGHAEFGGHTEIVLTESVDIVRSAEAAPVGVDRVIDYGRCERLEVRMDLFARELLLPRPVARRLHVAEELSAGEIADRLKAPIAVVAQQLLDALLLPPIAPTAATQRREPSLNDSQLAAVGHRGLPYILEAGPGTGKTQTLVARVDSLLSDGVDPSRILVLTFSNKAAGELSERIAAKNPSAAGTLWIGTFHAFGLDLIRRFHDRVGLPADPRLLDRVEAIELLEDEFARLNLKHFKNIWDPTQKISDILQACSRANDEVVDAARYQALGAAMLSAASDDVSRIAAERSLEAAKVYAAYEALKRDRGCIDFGDLISMPVRLCEKEFEVRQHLTTLYQHVLVDEYQDVNRASVRLLEAITDSGQNLWAVGDAKQSVYRFRGASSFNVARFGSDDFPGGVRGRLRINYRSSGEIVDTFLTFARGMRVVAGADVELKAERGKSGLRPLYRSVEKADDEIAAVADSIEESREDGFGYRDQALLCSGNDRLGKFATGLESLGIPVLFLGSIFERDEIKNLIAILSLLVDRRAMGVLRIATLPEFAMPLGHVHAVLEHLKALDAKPMEWLQAIEEIEGLSPASQSVLLRIRSLLSGFDSQASPWDVLARVLLDRSRFAAEIAASNTVQMRSRGIAIWQFMNFLRAQPRKPGLPISRLMDRIRKLVLLSDDRDLRQLPAAAQSIDAVRLMTMHGSKGLEFPVVHIPSLSQGTLPRSPNLAGTVTPPDGMVEGANGTGADAVKDSIAEEQECLFFVALSRARDHLRLYSPTQKANGHKWTVSPFVDSLGAMIDRQAKQPARRLPAEPSSTAVDIHFPQSISITGSQLSLYERCPRRFFYTHILEIGGRRTETAFMQMHGAVQQVIEKLAIAQTAAEPAQLTSLIEDAWIERGPHAHGYGDEFKSIADRLLNFYLSTQTGHTSQTTRLPLRFTVGSAVVVIKPDQVLARSTGEVVMRRVQTGHKRSSDDDSLASAAFRLAASESSPGCVVELVHLADEAVTPLMMSGTVLGNRRRKIQEALEKVQSGDFAQKEERTCPRCPAFFVCGPVPPGRLEKIFSEDLPVGP
ncbi:ATP-dependent DNA helicase [Hydrocarboniphaga effusa]|jgi:superfamily I DNA/RNA helicase